VRQQEFFEHVIRSLEKIGIPYMVTGSVGAMLYGEPRLTNDMDLVVRLTVESVAPLLAFFPSPDFYAPPPEIVRDEIRRQGQFNLIHVGSGSKVDLIIRKSTAFAREEFSRRRVSPFSESLDCQTAAPEDIVLSKLMSFREGGSEKHLRDIRGMLKVSGDEIDLTYVASWVDQLGLTSEWSRVLEE
jgi:hypothetical protein